MQRERIADLVHRVGQQGGGFAGKLQHAGVAAGDLVVGRFRQIDQQQHRDVAHLAHVADVDARIGHLAALQVDHRAHRGVEIDLVTVFLLAQPLHALRLQCLDEEFQPRHQRLVTRDDRLDVGRIARLDALLQQRAPARPFELDLVVPLRVVMRFGCRLTAFAGVPGRAVVVEQLGAQHPDFLRIVAGGLDVNLVDELHEVHVLDDLLLQPRGGRGKIRRFGKFPDEAIVVAVGRARARRCAAGRRCRCVTGRGPAPRRCPTIPRCCRAVRRARRTTGVPWQPAARRRSSPGRAERGRCGRASRRWWRSLPASLSCSRRHNGPSPGKARMASCSTRASSTSEITAICSGLSASAESGLVV